MLEHSLRLLLAPVVTDLLSMAHNGQQSNNVFHLPVTIERRWSWTNGWERHRPSLSMVVLVVVLLLSMVAAAGAVVVVMVVVVVVVVVFNPTGR